MLKRLVIFHVEAAEEAVTQTANDGDHHHFGDMVSESRSLLRFTDQNTQYQPRYGVPHDELRRAAENGGPEARFLPASSPLTRRSQA